MDSNNALLELLPLPCPSTSCWPYGYIFKSEWLKTRQKYKKKIVELRIEGLNDLISTNKPNHVIFYSKNNEYVKYWKAISKVEYAENDILIGKNSTTNFYIINHPTAVNGGIDYFEKIGRLMRKKEEK